MQLLQSKHGSSAKHGATFALKYGQQKTGGYAKDMTLRDYFAAKAMQSLVHQNYYEVAAKQAYEMADAMLKAKEA